MEKLSDLLEMAKVSDIIATKKEKEDNKIVWALAIIGAIAAVAGIAFAVYKYLTPDYMDDFDEDFDDDFDDLDSEDRGYTSIHPEDLSDDAEEDEPESGLSDTLTEDEKEALSDTETFSAKEEKEENTEEEE